MRKFIKCLTNCMSQAISIASAIWCTIVLCRICPRNIEFDYQGIIVAIFSLLITILITWQIWQTIISKEQIQKAIKSFDKLKKLESQLESQRTLFTKHNLEIQYLINAQAKIFEASKTKDLSAQYISYAEALNFLLLSNVGFPYEQFDIVLQELSMITGKFSNINNFEDAWNIIESETEFEWHYNQIISQLKNFGSEKDEFQRQLSLIRELRRGAIEDIKKSDIGKRIEQEKKELANLHDSLKAKRTTENIEKKNGN